MTALTLDLPDEKLRRLKVLAEARGTNIAQLFEEMSTAVLTEADAEAKPSDKGVAVRDLRGNKPCNANALHGFCLSRDFLAAKSTLKD